MAGNNFDTSITIRAGVEGISDLNHLMDIIGQAGGDVSQLREQTQRLSDTWHTLTPEEQTRQLNQLAQATQGLARDTNRATDQMERFLGVRSNNTINAEINQVNTALTTLRQRLDAGTISQEEFNRMSTAGQTRLNALQGELNQTSSGLNRMDNASNQAGGGMDKLTKGLMGMAGAYVGIESVTAGIHALIETSKQMDSLNQKLEYATGSAKDAGKTFSYLKDIANQYGLEQMSLANGYAQLASATKGLNMSQAETRQSFEGVAKATAAMSLSADDANGVFLALSQIASKGKVSMEELRGQLGERLTPAFGLAAKAMGVTTSELEKMVENGINAKEFLPKFGQAMAESFNDQAANNLHTTTGAINLLTNKLTDLKAKILDSFAGDGISSGLDMFSQGIDYINNAIDNIDPQSIEAVKQVFAQLFSVIGTIGSTIGGLYDDFNNLFSAMTGFDEASEKVGFLTRILQGLSIVIGAIDDVFKGLQATANFAIGGIMSAFADLYGAMAKLDILPDSMQAKYQSMSDGLRKASDGAFARFDKNVNEFESSTKKALDATVVSADQMAEKAEKASQKASDSFDELAKNAKASGDELAKGFGEAVARATAPEQVDGLIGKYSDLFQQGKITGEQLAQGMNLAKDKTEELEKSVGRQVPTMEELSKAGEKTAQNIKDKMADTATTLGLDFEKASNKTSDAFTKTAQATLNLGQNFNELKTEGYDASALIVQGLEKMQSTAKNKADFDLLNATIKQMGDEGKLSGDQVKQALEDSKKKATELQIGLSDVEKAYKSMGIASQAELAKKAADYKQAYDQIAKDATASETIKQQAYEKYAQAAIDANNGVMTSEVKNQAAARGYADVVVENGKISTKTAEEIAQANKKSEESHKKVTQSTKEQGDAAKEAAEKGKQAAAEQEKAHSSFMGGLAKMYDNFTGSIAKGLQNVGISGEQSIQLMNNALRGQAYMMNSWDGFFKGFANAQKNVQASINSFTEVRNSAISMTQALSGAEVTTNDLGLAQLALQRAAGATVNGIVKMDNATLDNLKRQIDSTRQKFDDLSKSAKDTADGLQTQLARLKDDDTTARQLEQTKKLADLQDKINESRKRGNAEEIAQLQRAFDLQKQINDEENRQASVKLEQEQQAKQANAQKQAQANSSYNQPVQSTSNNTQSVNAKDVANSFADLIEQAKKDGANELAKQLMDEAKRLAR